MDWQQDLLQYVVRHLDHKRGTFTQQIDYVKQNCTDWTPDFVIIETNFKQSALYDSLITEVGHKWAFIDIESVDDKVERIYEQEPDWRKGSFLYAFDKLPTAFYIEFNNFPNADHDDIMDAHHMAWSFLKTQHDKRFVGVASW